MYRKCTVDLVQKSGFRLPEATVVNGGKQSERNEEKKVSIKG